MAEDNVSKHIIRAPKEIETNQPLIGIIATTTNSERIPAAILRARNKGYQTIVTALQSDVEGLQFARELDAQIVPPPKRGQEKQSARIQLQKAAREAGYPGLLIHTNLSEQIDYEKSKTELVNSDHYSIDTTTVSRIKDKPSVLVAIPAYNEATSIKNVVTEAKDYSDEVLVIDDGSTDETAELAQAAGATVIVHQENKGYGGSLKTAFTEAKRSQADHLVILDGDGQHDPNDIPHLIQTQKERDSEIIIGSRFTDDSKTSLPLYRRIGLAVVNGLTNLSMGIVHPKSRVRDTQSGFRAYDRKAIQSLANDETIGDQMGASTDILHHAHQNDYSIVEVGTTIRYDVDNASSHNPISHGTHLVMNLLQTVEEEHPISSLGFPGFIGSVIGIGFAYLTIANYIDTGSFPLGLALVSVFFTLAGIFACFTSIILHSLEHHTSS